MATGARVIQIYKKSSNRERLDLICDNYNRIENILKADVNGMLLLIIEDKASMKRQEKGDLGVRVQSSGIPSDPTGTQGDNEIMLEEAILKCDFSDGIIAGIDHEYFIKERADAHRLIRRDLGKFREQLDCLQDDEREFFLPYITKAKCIDDMAEELGISYNSTQRRISRIKRKIDEGMHPYDYAI